MNSLPYKHIHLCGIGGAGVSGLARILLEQGIAVSGSDKTPTDVTKALEKKGTRVWHNESAANLAPDVDLLVYSAAVKPEHPERAAASARGIPQKKYAEVIGELTQTRKTICVCGTHGKTSTTSMTATLLRETGLKPGWVVGGVPRSLPASAHWDSGEHFVLESCEYDRSFLNYSPAAVVLHNIEPDHMDYFKTFENLCGAFEEFSARLGPDGVLFANYDCVSAREIARRCTHQVISYGESKDARYRAADVDVSGAAPSFTLLDGKKELARITLAMPGRVHVSNALAACAAALWAGVKPALLAPVLGKVESVKRRFELVGMYRGAPVIDDYAHHPTAVRELVASARAAYPKRKLVFVFQAHQYARLVGFFDDFVGALTGVDEVIVCRTYAAREKDVVIGEPEERLTRALIARDTPAFSVATFDEAIERAKGYADENAAIFTVGAGDVTDLAHRMVREGRRSQRAA